MLSHLLKDIRVLDISSVLAGPSVGMFLAELGAEVIKIENPNTNGDITRQWKNPKEHPSHPISAYYASVNAFKKIEFLNFNIPDNVQKIHQLIPQIDIVIANFKYGDDKKFQLDYNTLKQLNPRLIYAQITGFGKADTRIAYDLVLQAETGFMYLNRPDHQLPNKMPVALIDVLAAHQLKEGILLALYQRLKTGQGSYVHCSLYDAAVCSLVNQAANYLVAGFNPPPMGSEHPNIAPYGELFETYDKQYITFAIGSNRQFADLCQLLNLNDIAEHPNFSSNADRVKNRKELYQILQEKIKHLPAAEIYNKCLQNDIPVALIKDIESVMKDQRTQRLIKPVEIEGQKLQIITSIAFEIV